MRRLLFVLLLAALPLMAQRGRVGIKHTSTQVDGLFNSAGEQSAPFRLDDQITGNAVTHDFSVNAIASGAPTTCTWNVYCTNKIAQRDTIAAGDYNKLNATDLSCLATNSERLTRFIGMPFSTCKIVLETIGGGTTPAVEFYKTGVAP